MKITFLGTADGLPRPGHHCTSTMIEENGAIYLIDAGAPVADLLLRLGKDFKSIKAIFNTHGHNDHLDGALQLLNLCNWAYKDSSYDVFLPEQKIADGILGYMQCFSSQPIETERLRLKSFGAGTVYEDNSIRVTAIPTHHCDPRPSYAFFVESRAGRRVLFTGDLSVVNGDFPEIAYEEPTDLIVCEMAHFGAEHLAPCLKKCKTKQVIFNHYQRRKERDILQLSQCAGLPFPVHAAKDMDIIEVY